MAAVLALAIFAGLPEKGSAAPPDVDGRGDIDVVGLPGDEGIGHAVEGESSGDPVASHRPGRGTARANTARPVVYYGDFPALVVGPDGRYCIRLVRRPYGEHETAAVYETRQEQRWMELTGSYQLCPGVAPPARSPAAQAVEYWRVIGEDLLPRPQPRIAPGYMLAGKLAYLEVGSPVQSRFEHTTPLGVLVVDASSEVFVDWGDGGGLDGPHHGAGAPWPHGDITHSWTHARTYDVRVVQRWSASWRLGAATGRLDGLATEGSIADFEVRDLQAVRNL